MRLPLLCLLALLLAAVSPSAAETIRIPRDASTIQAGIDAAMPGDTILVAPGTYRAEGNKDLDFTGKDLVVVSESGPEETVIDCEGEGRGFQFYSGETEEAKVIGLTIANGGVTEDGGGIYCYRASPTIESCYIVECSADASGGGIYLHGSHSLVRQCTAEGCRAKWSGGGVDIFGGNPLLSGCMIKNNTANKGGGVLCGEGQATVEDCSIIDNRAVVVYVENTFVPAWGAGVFSGGSSVVLKSCAISGNRKADLGGGLFHYSGRMDMTRCTIFGNSAAWGGGIYHLKDTLNVARSTVAHNMASVGGGTVFHGSTVAAFESSIIWGNCASDGAEDVWLQEGAGPIFTRCNVDPSRFGGESQALFVGEQIETDPRFCFPVGCGQFSPRSAGDYGLLAESPCLAFNNPWGVTVGAHESCVSDTLPGGPPTLRTSRLQPNPTTQWLEFKVNLTHRSHVKVGIYDVAGRLVDELYDRPLWPGEHVFTWNASTAPNRVADGIYFVRIDAGGIQRAGKFLLLR